MHMLEREQANFGRNVLRGVDAASLPRLTARPGADPYARMNVYRNNTYASLTAALLAVFPVTARLVDERFFRFAAHQFIGSFPPNEPRLSQFGARFPDFLTHFEQLEAMPFVAATARLEWLIATALDRPVLPSLPLSSLNWLEKPERASFRLQPSLLATISRWPVFSIWTAHQDEAEPDLGFVISGRVERTVLWRSGPNIRLARSDAGQFRFLRSIAAGASLERAATRALAGDPLFDLARSLAQLFGDGLVAGIARDGN